MLKNKNNNYNQIVTLFVATVIGCIITNVWIWQSYDMSLFDLLSIKGFGSFGYNSICNIIFKRIEQMAVLLLCIRVFRIDIVLNIIVIVFGFVLGFMLTIQSYYQGIKGIFVIMFVIIPPFVFYYFSLLNVKKYIRYFDEKSIKIRIIMLSILFFLIGILFECYFSEKIFDYFYQYMVTKI